MVPGARARLQRLSNMNKHHIFNAARENVEPRSNSIDGNGIKKLSSTCAPGSADRTGYWWMFRTHFLPACRDTQSMWMLVEALIPTSAHTFRGRSDSTLSCEAKKLRELYHTMNYQSHPGLVDISASHAKRKARICLSPWLSSGSLQDMDFQDSDFLFTFTLQIATRTIALNLPNLTMLDNIEEMFRKNLIRNLNTRTYANVYSIRRNLSNI